MTTSISITHQDQTLTATAQPVSSTLQWQASKDGEHWRDISGQTTATYSASVTDVGLFIRVTASVSGGSVESSTPVFVTSDNAPTPTASIVSLDAATFDPSGVSIDISASSSGVVAKDPADYVQANIDVSGFSGAVNVEVVEATAGTAKQLLVKDGSTLKYTVTENHDGSFDVLESITGNSNKTTLIGVDSLLIDGKTYTLQTDVWAPVDVDLAVDGTPWVDGFNLDLPSQSLATGWVQDANGAWLLKSGDGAAQSNLLTVTRAAPGADYDFLLDVAAGVMGSGAAAKQYALTDIEVLGISLGGVPQAGLSLDLTNVTLHVLGTVGDDAALTGTTGNDVINGLGGDDTLTGNGGDDVFLYKTDQSTVDDALTADAGSPNTYTGFDVITDFDAGDTIRLEANGVALLPDGASSGLADIADQSYRVIQGTYTTGTREFASNESGGDSLVLYDAYASSTIVPAGIVVTGIAPTALMAALNPPPTVTIDSYAVNSGSPTPLSGTPVALGEGDVLSVTLKRSGDLSQASDVSWLVTFPNAGGADYDDLNPYSGVANFADGASTAVVTINVVDDLVEEGQEGLVFGLDPSSSDNVNVGFPVDSDPSDSVPAAGMSLAANIAASDPPPLDIMAGDGDIMDVNDVGNGRPELHGVAAQDAQVTITAPDGTTTFTATADANGHFSVELASVPSAGLYEVSDGVGTAEAWLGTGGADSMTGTSETDLIFAGNGNDSVNAGAGDDYIVFSRGQDTIDGGEDFDTLELPFDPSANPVVRDLVKWDETLGAEVVHIQTYQKGVGFVDAFTVGEVAGHTMVTAVEGGHTADMVNVESIALGDFEHVLVPSLQQEAFGYALQSGTRRDDSLDLTVNFDTVKGYLDYIPDVDGGEGKDTLTITFNGGTLTHNSSNTNSDFAYLFTPAGTSQTEEIVVSYSAPWPSVSPGSPAQEGYISVGSLGDLYSVETLILQGSGQTPSFTVHLADLQREEAAFDSIDDENEIPEDDQIDDDAWLSAAKTPANGFRVLDGKGGDDHLVGTDVDDEDEKDHLKGGEGDDQLEGRGGYNRLDGGEGRDEASYAMAERGVKVDIFRTDEQATGVSHDTILNVENLLGSAFADTLGGNGWSNALDGNAGHDELFGGRGHDILLGGDGHDFLDGGIGNDTLNGGKGSDVLKGGVGADIFVFDAMDFYFSGPDVIPDIDTILDFNSFADQIKVINAGSLAKLEYDNATGELLYDADGDDPTGAAQVIATMEAGLGLSEAHWVL